MQTVTFRAGDTIISEGDDGNIAFLIASGVVYVSVGHEAMTKTIGTLGVGECSAKCALSNRARDQLL